LEELELNENSLSSIHADTFQGLTSIKILSLSDNKLNGKLNPYTFNHLANLEKLYLNQNKLTSIHSSTFRGLTSIKDLRLWGNELSGELELDRRTFNDLTQLEILDLNSNRLTSIHFDTFRGLTNMKALHLWGNELSGELDPRTFKDLTQLEILDSSNNKLTSIHSDTFRGLTRIKALGLSRNKLSGELDPQILNDLSKLEKLHLHDNKLESIHADTFIINGDFIGQKVCSHQMPPIHVPTSISVYQLQQRNLCNSCKARPIEILSLAFNRLTSIHFDTFRGLVSIKELSSSPLRPTNIK
jgi:Leucine-rich repeat (LRR) protein